MGRPAHPASVDELRLALEELIDVLERMPITGPSDPRELPLARAKRALARSADR